MFSELCNSYNFIINYIKITKKSRTYHNIEKLTKVFIHMVAYLNIFSVSIYSHIKPFRDNEYYGIKYIIWFYLCWMWSNSPEITYERLFHNQFHIENYQIIWELFKSFRKFLEVGNCRDDKWDKNLEQHPR